MSLWLWLLRRPCSGFTAVHDKANTTGSLVKMQVLSCTGETLIDWPSDACDLATCARNAAPRAASCRLHPQEVKSDLVQFKAFCKGIQQLGSVLKARICIPAHLEVDQFHELSQAIQAMNRLGNLDIWSDHLPQLEGETKSWVSIASAILRNNATTLEELTVPAGHDDDVDKLVPTALEEC